MANRDVSQKVGFVYTNIYHLYKKAKTENGNIVTKGKVFRPEEAFNIKITKFEPRILDKNAVTKVAASSSEAAKPNHPFEDLKGNLKRLEDLHSQLRFMLKELEDLVGKK